MADSAETPSMERKLSSESQSPWFGNIWKSFKQQEEKRSSDEISPATDTEIVAVAATETAPAQMLQYASIPKESRSQPLRLFVACISRIEDDSDIEDEKSPVSRTSFTNYFKLPAFRRGTKVSPDEAPSAGKKKKPKASRDDGVEHNGGVKDDDGFLTDES